MQLNATELADALQVERRTITNWVNEEPPCPSEKAGAERVFDLAKVMAWREERAVRKAREKWEKERADGGQSPRGRLTAVQAELKEMELARVRREMVPIADATGFVESFVGGFVSVASGQLARFERDMGLPPAGARLLRQRIHRALMEGATGFAEQLDEERRLLDAERLAELTAGDAVEGSQAA